MPASSVFVNGKTTKKPGVYPSADASAIGQGNTPRGDIAVVGAFPELQNDVATTYYSAATLRAASPDNKDFARIAKLAFSPGAGSGGARSVTLVNVQTTSQAFRTFRTGAAADSLTIKSKLWGQRGNMVWYEMKQNTGDPTKGYDFRFIAPGFKTESFTNLQSGELAQINVTCTELQGADDAVTATINPTSWKIDWQSYIANAETNTYTKLVVGSKVYVSVSANSAAPVLFTVVGKDTMGIARTGTATVEIVDQTGLVWVEVKVVAAEVVWGEITSIANNAGGGAWKCKAKGTAYELTCSNYENIAAICSAIDNNAPKGWTAVTKSPKAALAPAIETDAQTAVDVKGVAASVRADLWAIVTGLAGSNIITASRATAATLPPVTLGLPATTTGQLLGGSETAVTVATDYADALTKLRSKVLTNMTVFSDDVDAQTALSAHLLEKATVYGKPCGSWVGAAAATSLADLVIRANTLYDRNIGLVADKIKIAAVTTGGLAEWLDPKYLAVMMCGAQAGLPIGTPLTEKNLDVLDISHSWTDDSDEDAVIDAGVCALYRNDIGKPTVLRSVTTSQENEVYAESSAVDSMNYSILDLTQKLKALIGEPQDANVSPSILQTLAVGILTEQRDAIGCIKDFANVLAVAQGDAYSIDYDLAVIRPLNFIQTTAHLVP